MLNLHTARNTQIENHSINFYLCKSTYYVHSHTHPQPRGGSTTMRFLYINVLLNQHHFHITCRGTCFTALRLIPLSCIAWSSFSNRSSNSLNNERQIMLGARLSDLLCPQPIHTFVPTPTELPHPDVGVT